MGIDIHAFVECDFQNKHQPFTDPESIRCLNQGEFFIWRDLGLFHTLGLNYWRSELPLSPIQLKGIPRVLSHQLVMQQSLVVSPYVNSIQQSSDNDLKRFPTSFLTTWKEQDLQFFPIRNAHQYDIELKPGETLIFDPGCELPNWIPTHDIVQAFNICKPKGAKVSYFLAIVALMEKMVESLSSDHVRLIYWFDFLSPEFMRDYKQANGLANKWPVQ